MVKIPHTLIERVVVDQSRVIRRNHHDCVVQNLASKMGGEMQLVCLSVDRGMLMMKKKKMLMSRHYFVGS